MSVKAPSGAKHARCDTHVPHPYTSNGWLCSEDIDGWRPAEVLELADHLARVAAEHHAAEARRPAPEPTDAARKAKHHGGVTRTPFDPTGLVPHHCEAAREHGDRARSKYVSADDKCPACGDDRCAVSDKAPCTICQGAESAPVHHGSRYVSNPHDYSAPPVALAYAVPEVRILSAERWIPADLFEPAQSVAVHHRRTMPAPASVPAPARASRPRTAPAPRPTAKRTARPVGASAAALAALAAPSRFYKGGSCQRCGETFRTENGRAWHDEHRPHCADEAARRAVRLIGQPTIAA